MAKKKTVKEEETDKDGAVLHTTVERSTRGTGTLWSKGTDVTVLKETMEKKKNGAEGGGVRARNGSNLHAAAGVGVEGTMVRTGKVKTDRVTKREMGRII